jgi:hypothetical protein
MLQRCDAPSRHGVTDAPSWHGVTDAPSLHGVTDVPDHSAESNEYSAFKIALSTTVGDVPGFSKGCRPESMMKSTTPSDHMSTDWSYGVFLLACSGAQYVHVPTLPPAITCSSSVIRNVNHHSS